MQTRESNRPALIAVDVGNSRIKLGRFDDARQSSQPQPTDTLNLLLQCPPGNLDTGGLATWCKKHVGNHATWLVASVHRAAAEELTAAIADLAAEAAVDWPLRRVTYRDVPLPIEVDYPDRVGIDRLLAALAADRLRSRQRAAIVVDLGSAITVDVVTPKGAFAGGAILPGMAMSARALDEQTDALPLVSIERLSKPPVPLGKETTGAIESGLFWGTVGAVAELVNRLAADFAEPPEVFMTGGASPQIVELVAAHVGRPVEHAPHLVLSGIAIIHQLSGGIGS